MRKILATLAMTLMMLAGFTPAYASAAPAAIIKVQAVKPAPKITDNPSVRLYLMDQGASDRARFKATVSPTAKGAGVKRPTTFQTLSMTKGLESYFKATAKKYKTSTAFERNTFACYVDSGATQKDYDKRTKAGNKRIVWLSDCLNTMIVKYKMYN